MLLVYDPAVGRVDYEHNKRGELRGAALTLTKQGDGDVLLLNEILASYLKAVKHLDVAIMTVTKHIK